MLKNEITKQGDAVEKYFCEPFMKAQMLPMSKEDSEFLIRLLMAEKVMSIPQKEKPGLYQIIENRVKGCFSYKITDERLILFLTIITKSPGTAVMFLTYLQYWCKKHNCKELDLEKLCNVFPIGFPGEDELQRIWEGQKVQRDREQGGSDNLLDYQSAMTSIHFLIPEQNG